MRHWTAPVLLAAFVAAAGCDKGPPQLAPPEPPVVTVARPVEKDLDSYTEFTGRLVAVKNQEVRAQVTGYLKKLLFKDGQLVKAGDPLYLIDPVPYTAELNLAKGKLAEAEAQAKRTTTEAERAEKLFAKNQTIPEEERDRAVASRDSAVAAVASAKAAVDKAEFDLKNTTVVSDTTGRVGRTLITEGNLVATGTTLLTTITSITPIYAVWDVDETTSLWYREQVFKKRTIADPRDEKTQLKCWIRLRNETGFDHAGTVDYIDPVVDRDTGTRVIRGVFDNADTFLNPGDSVRVRVEAGPSRGATLVSELAIGSQQRQKFVYVVNDKDEVEFRPVTLGPVRDGMQIVESGVTPADRVIVNGLLRVRPGAKVSPREAEGPASRKPAEAKSGSVPPK